MSSPFHTLSEELRQRWEDSDLVATAFDPSEIEEDEPALTTEEAFWKEAEEWYKEFHRLGGLMMLKGSPTYSLKPKWDELRRRCAAETGGHPGNLYLDIERRLS